MNKTKKKVKIESVNVKFTDYYLIFGRLILFS